eukprot:1093340-Pelagomonas_calceolata.AAC.1
MDFVGKDVVGSCCPTEFLEQRILALSYRLHCSTAQARTAALLKNRRQHCCSTDLQGGLQHCSSNNRTSRNVTGTAIRRQGGASKKASDGKVHLEKGRTFRVCMFNALQSCALTEVSFLWAYRYNAVHAHLDDAVCGDGVEVEQRGTSRVKGGHYILWHTKGDMQNLKKAIHWV